MGNILRHQYDGIDMTIVLATIRRDLPPLETALLEISPINLPGQADQGG
jgi:uncharacterized protein with HEPN domain